MLQKFSESHLESEQPYREDSVQISSDESPDAGDRDARLAKAIRRASLSEEEISKQLARDCAVALALSYERPVRKTAGSLHVVSCTV